MSTPTTNFGLTKPGVNDPVDQNQWGYQLNSDLDIIDLLLFLLSTTGIGVSPPSYTMPGTLWVDNSTDPWILKIYDGTDFVSIGTIDTITNEFNPVNGTPLTNKGDLLTSDGTSQLVLPVGTDGQVLTADSSQSLGIKWAAGGGGGTGSIEAWASIDVVAGVPAIVAQSNVSSVTDSGVGRYGINFTSSLPSANYVMAGSIQRASGADDALVGMRTGVTRTSSFCPIYVMDTSGNHIDPKNVNILFVGG